MNRLKLMKLVFVTSITGMLNSYGQQSFYSRAPDSPVINFVTAPSSTNETKINGSPYLEETFTQGKVIKKGKTQLVAMMRYNAYTNEVEIKDGSMKEGYSSLYKRSEFKAIIGDKTYGIHVFKDNDGALRSSYFIELNQGDTKLLFKPEAILRQARRPDTSYGRYVPPTYVWNNSYYIIDNGNSGDENYAVETRLSKRRILKYLNTDTESLKQYIKREDLNLRHKEDVVDLFHFYNTLD